MPSAALFSTMATLRNGLQAEIRALRPQDRQDMLAALGRTSSQSLYRRFFGVRRDFSEAETAFFLDVDFVKHVALIAVVEEEGGRVVAGGGRYIVTKPGQAEIAFAVVDQFQSLGIGTVLLHHLSCLAREAGLQEFIAEVLAENAPMLGVFEKSGLKRTTRRESHVVHMVLQLE
jgi:GNAT superfamily N-acetyltransferase